MNFWHGTGSAECGPRDPEPEWADSQVDCLVQLYRLQPCLWDKDNRSYLDYSSRRRAYEWIHRGTPTVGVTLVEVIMKIRNLRKIYVDELRRRFEAQMAGSVYESQYSWFDELHEFLNDHLTDDEYEIIESSMMRDKLEGCPSERTQRSSVSDRTISTCRSRGPRLSASHSLASSLRADACPGQLRESGQTDQSLDHHDSPCGLSLACSEAFSSRLCSSTRLSRCSCASSNRSVDIYKGPRPVASVRSSVALCTSCDRLDVFARSIAHKLKLLEPGTAAVAQAQIQKVLAIAARDSKASIQDKPQARLAISNPSILQPEEYCSCPEISGLPNARVKEAAKNNSKKTIVM